MWCASPTCSKPISEKAMPVPALEVRDLTVGYGDRSVLRGLSMKVEPGQLVALIGASASVKTTLLRTVSGLLRPVGVSIFLDGFPLQGQPPHRVVESGFV